MKPYTHGEYQLYTREVNLRNNNGTQRIYFFAKNEPKSGVPTELPRGYRVEPTPTGLPILRKDPTAELAQNTGIIGRLKRFFN